MNEKQTAKRLDTIIKKLEYVREHGAYLPEHEELLDEANELLSRVAFEVQGLWDELTNN